MTRRSRRVGTVVAAVLALALGLLVLWPDGEAIRRIVVDVYVAGLRAGVPARVTPEWYAAVLNVLVVVPVAWLGVVALGRRPWRVVAWLAAASAAVETAQLLPLLHRDATVLDVVCNTAGALLGAGLGSLAVRHDLRHRDGLDDEPGLEERADERPDVRRDDVR